MWSKYKATADKSLSGDSSWCCVNLSHDRQLARVVETSTAVCLSLRAVGLQNKTIRILLHSLHAFINCKKW
jgi:hypothetical protein